MSKADLTRRMIIEKTAPLFNTRGFGGTSLNDMTRATGLSKGSIYGNFTNKDEVALAAFDHNMERIHLIITAEMSKQTTARNKLLVYVNVYGNFLKHPFPDGGCPMLNTATECDDTHPALKKKASQAILNWKQTIEGLIEEGKQKKEFQKSTKAEENALTIIATIEGAIMITKLTGRLNYRSAIMQAVKKIIDNL